MKKEQGRIKQNKLIILAIFAVFLLMAVFLIYGNLFLTGNASGITIGTPKTIGLTSNQPITISGDITKKLCAASYTTDVAAVSTDIANRINGGVEGAIKDGLGIPSAELPDVYGVLALVAGYLQQSPNTKCLRQIGVATCGKEWKGTLYVNFDMIRKKSALYPDWEYYNEKLRYVGQGIDCTAELGCAFSYNPNTKDLKNSCLGKP